MLTALTPIKLKAKPSPGTASPVSLDSGEPERCTHCHTDGSLHTAAHDLTRRTEQFEENTGLAVMHYQQTAFEFGISV